LTQLPQQTWTIPHGWIREFSAAEWPENTTDGGTGVENQITGSTVTILIQAALPGQVDYDGKNLIDVKGGTPAQN